jgi:hypothetical protein
MSNKSDFEAHEAIIRGVDPKNVVHPNMPMGIYTQEAEDLSAWIVPDVPVLIAKGLSQQVVDNLPQLIGAVRYIQSQWNSNRFSKEEAQKQFTLLAPEAYDLVARLVHEMLFAYRKHPDLKGRVQAIAEGSGDADMIQDLSDLSVHGKNNPEPLVAIGFDMALLDEAAAKSDELASLLGVARGEKAVDSEVKVLRDKAYTLLKESVDEIREYGQFVFWRNQERLPGYGSAHLRRQRNRSDAKKAGQPEPGMTDAP